MNKSIRQTLSDASAVLGSAGVTEARMEVVSLLAYVLHADRTYVITNLEDELRPELLQSFNELLDRRVRHEPLQYIVGHQEFFGLDFEVTREVLIPRPETELVVEAALGVSGDSAASILDIGTGSGCILIALLHNLPESRGAGVDISAGALQVARKNARRHGVADRLSLVQSDQFAALAERAQFSLVVSNPPYVPEPQMETLPPEVREYEPWPALVSGPDGLSHIRVLLRDAPLLLRTAGYLIFEIGFGQSEAVKDLVDPAIWRLIEVREDLQRIPRTVVLQKR